MQPFTPLAVVVVFLIGAVCGALLTAIQRHARLHQIQLAFQTDLQALCDRFFLDSEDPRSVRITEAADNSLGSTSSLVYQNSEIASDSLPNSTDFPDAHITAQVGLTHSSPHISG